MTRAFDLVCFDLDGTLIDSAPDIRLALNRALHDFGFPALSLTAVRTLVGDGARQLVERAVPPGSSADFGRLLDVFRRHYLNDVLVETTTYPGIPEMLDALGDTPLALVTNKPAAHTQRILEGLSWAGRFQVVVGGDSLPERKPHPSVLRTVCGRCGVEPSRAVMIGDSPQDMGAALSVGAIPVGVTWGYRSGEVLQDAGATRLFGVASDLRDFLCRARGVTELASR